MPRRLTSAIGDILIWWTLGATIECRRGAAMGPRPVGRHRGKGRHQILLGARASARRKPDFHEPDCFALELPCQQRMTLSASTGSSPTPRCARRSRASASPCSPTPARSPHDLTHCLDALAAAGHQRLRRVRAAARPARRQAGQYDGVARTSPIRCYGIPVFSLYGEVRRPTGQSMGTFDVAAGRPAGSRLPHLHLHHHPALRARGGGAARQERSGCSTGPTRPAGRSRG